MGVTSRCLASRDNLIKKRKLKILYGYFVSVYSVSSGCWHHCVVCTVCMDYAFLAFVTLHAVRDSWLPCTVFDRVGVTDFFHPSFSLIFLRHFHHPFHLAIWFQLFACLIRAAIFHLTLAFVLTCLSSYICHKLLSWPFLFLVFCCCFCRRHLRSVYFSACLGFLLLFVCCFLGCQPIPRVIFR